jgi:hypothetical protein
VAVTTLQDEAGREPALRQVLLWSSMHARFACSTVTTHDGTITKLRCKVHAILNDAVLNGAKRQSMEVAIGAVATW